MGRAGSLLIAALVLAAACGGAGSGGGGGAGSQPSPPACNESPYPAGPYGNAVGAILADSTWPAARADGTRGTLALHELFDPCGQEPRVAVVRVVAAWCGPCRWSASHAGALLGSDVGPRVRLLDVILRDEDNAPATIDAALAWQSAQDVKTAVAVDAAMTTLAWAPARTSLPFVLMVDRQTMSLLDAFAPSDEDELEDRVRSTLSAIDGASPPASPAPQLVDGRFHRDQWDMIVDMSLMVAPPADPTDAFADDPRASDLGAALFSDTTLSPHLTASCKGCHDPARQFTDAFPTSPEGVGRVDRNAPSLDLVSYQRWQFWDGRADSLWAQALGPMEAPNEFGSSRLYVDQVVFARYRTQYEALFGPMPPLELSARFPTWGKPGDPGWDAMSPADRDAATRVFVNVGKSLEAYERSLRGLPIALDRYAAGDATALTDAQKDGLLAFFTAGCAQCHWGNRLTDDAFHVARFPTGRSDLKPDPGRSTGIPLLVASEFGAGSRYSDDPSRARPSPTAGPWTVGAFKTPGLRSVALTAPYGHGGNYVALRDVIELHRTAGRPPGDPLTTGDAERWLPAFDASSEDALAAFLGTLTMGFTR